MNKEGDCYDQQMPVETMSEKHARQVWHAQSKSRVLHALIGNFSTLSLLHTYSTRPLAPSPFTSIRTTVGASSLADNFLHCLPENANTTR